MLIDLSNRSTEQELMDQPSIDANTLHVALADISRVNRLLGGNNITLQAVFNYIDNAPSKKEWVIVDIGCGDGMMLRKISEVADARSINMRLIGIDTNLETIKQATRESISYPTIQYDNQDILTIATTDYVCDIILCTLTLHHFTEIDIKKVLKKSLEVASGAIIINDLHRSQLAYYLFKIFSVFFIKGYVAKNDGLVSIQRGFKQKELVAITEELGIHNYQLRWKWAFRYCWILYVQ